MSTSASRRPRLALPTSGKAYSCDSSLVALIPSNATRGCPPSQRPLKQRCSREPKRSKTSQSSRGSCPLLWTVATTTLKNSLGVARVHPRIDPRKPDGSRVVSKDASIHKDYSRASKGRTYRSYEERNPSTTVARGTGRDRDGELRMRHRK